MSSRNDITFIRRKGRVIPIRKKRKKDKGVSNRVKGIGSIVAGTAVAGIGATIGSFYEKYTKFKYDQQGKYEHSLWKASKRAYRRTGSRALLKDVKKYERSWKRNQGFARSNYRKYKKGKAAVLIGTGALIGYGVDKLAPHKKGESEAVALLKETGSAALGGIAAFGAFRGTRLFRKSIMNMGKTPWRQLYRGRK